MAHTLIVYSLMSIALFGAIRTHASHALNIETVLVGNPNNPNDPTDGNDLEDGIQHFGSVAYSFRMGKYEVTNAQYLEFLNIKDPSGENTLGLYHDGMTTNANGGIDFDSGALHGSKYILKPGRGNNPVNYTSLADSFRFANWLHNGQGNADTEVGAYTILNGGSLSSIYNVVRNPSAKWFVPSEDEWYKAAYYDPRTESEGGPIGDDHYWRFPMQADSDADIFSDNPASLNTPDSSSSANFRKNDSIANGFNGGFAVTNSEMMDVAQNYVTNVGAYRLARSYYGTFDQGGNVNEWTEAIDSGFFPSQSVLRGGSWVSIEGYYLAAFGRTGASALGSRSYYGFRVATLVPEPTTVPLLISGIAGAILLPAAYRPLGTSA
ncbi:MAG: SUMF1/EgtB/PvdO family nonheme iron enzyme [Pirellulales bacterium]